MIVIGMAGKKYICTVEHSELEKLTDKYYGNLDRLKVGDILDLGAGYDFSDRIHTACKTMLDSMKRFEEAKGTLTRFAVMVTEHKGISND